MKKITLFNTDHVKNMNRCNRYAYKFKETSIDIIIEDTKLKRLYAYHKGRIDTCLVMVENVLGNKNELVLYIEEINYNALKRPRNKILLFNNYNEMVEYVKNYYKDQ